MLTKASSLSRLVGELKKLPGVGERTALRLAFHLLKSPQNLTTLAEALLEVRAKVRTCSTCFAITEDDPCTICSGRRDTGTICVVENSQDLMALERSNAYHGVYHVLEGAISPLAGVGPDALRISELLERIHRGGVNEVVIATNFSVEGEATALYLAKLLKSVNIKVSRLAHGIPLGSDIEFVDAATVQWALQGRNEL
ncbi:recombination mediator RecR [Pelotalea chapellei]|uniref:Recombination protein RecR n=1 Tax=Pelotalea chapellei TaxID=44671 RepID=A0ABS5U4N4_9BACT|nr:recombination mediator RecR [Pelotalea chapellei]MBT1070640.1 recombination mediator RecR [Pelotalea chapellei]